MKAIPMKIKIETCLGFLQEVSDDAFLANIWNVFPFSIF